MEATAIELVERVVKQMESQPTIYVWPRRLDKNKYLDLLYDAVSQLGHEVHPLRWRPSNIIKAALRRRKNKWLHFHWVGLPPRSFILTFCYWMVILGGMLFLRLGGVRLIWTLHDIRPHNSRWVKLDYRGYKLVLRMTSIVMSHSEWVVAQLRELYGWNGRTVVAPHGNYIGAYSSRISPGEVRTLYSTSSDAKVFLFVGTLSPYKGIDQLISAFKGMDSKGSALWVVGSGSGQMISDLKALIGNDSRITLDARYVPDDELGSLLMAADVVVLPYTNISTSGSLVLAHSFGKPVIAPRLGSIPEYTSDEASVLYDRSDPDGLAEALSKCLTLDTRNMGNHALRISKTWSWEAVAHVLIQSIVSM